MKRERLRIKLSEATLNILGAQHALTLPNAIRYVKPELPSYNIRRSTEITNRDWNLALQVTRKYLAHRIGKSSFFRSIERLPIQDRLSSVLRSLRNQ